jgi:hypothetical protein
MTRKLIYDSANICLKRTDFSEPQTGKDQADRDIAVGKSCLKAYMNRGKNVLGANSIKKALDESFGNLPNSKTSVSFWQYFDIGGGLPKNLINCICILHTSIVESFTDAPYADKEFSMKSILQLQQYFFLF